MARDIAAFGAEAERYAQRLPDHIRAVVTDGTDSAEALAEAVYRRTKAEPFFVGILYEDPRAREAVRISREVNEAALDADEARTAFDSLNTSQPRGYPSGIPIGWDPGIIKTLRDLLICGDALLARSRVELTGVEAVLGRCRPHSVIWPAPHARLETRRSPRRELIVVWAPDRSAAELALFRYALSHLRAECIVISAEDGGSTSQAVANKRMLLDEATVIVDASLSDPAFAIAATGLRRSLVISSSTGAAEFIDGAFVYDSWDWRSIARAIVNARSTRSLPKPAETLSKRGLSNEYLKSKMTVKGPLVSIVISTYNRPEKLRRCLEKLERQIYRNFEVVVGNDGGDSIDHVAAAFPFVRVVNHPINRGATGCASVTLPHARGDYIAFCADDDLFYPDHLSRLVQAALYTGAKVVHSNILVRVVDVTDQGPFTCGFISNYDDFVDRTQGLWIMQTLINGLLLHSSVFREVPLDSSFRVAPDVDFTMRLLERFEFYHVDHVTGEFEYRYDGTNWSTRNVGLIPIEVERVYEQHPVINRPLVEKARSETLSILRSWNEGVRIFDPPQRLKSSSGPRSEAES